MTHTLEQPIPNRPSHPRPYDEMVIVSAGAPIVLSVWQGDPGAPTVVFLPGTMTHPLFYQEFLEGLHRRGLSVVGVHYQGHGKSPRVRSRLGWANLVANATDAVDWAATHLDGPVVLLGSSQGGLLAMAVAARSRRLALVAAHNVLDPALPESLTVSRLPRWLVGVYQPLLAAQRLAAHLAWAAGAVLDVPGPGPGLRPARDPHPVPDRPPGAACLPAGIPSRAVHRRPVRHGRRQHRLPGAGGRGQGGSAVQFGLHPAGVDRMVAPAKELLMFEVDRHLLFNENECVELVTGPLVDRIRRLVAMPGSAGVPCR